MLCYYLLAIFDEKFFISFEMHFARIVLFIFREAHKLNRGAICRIITTYVVKVVEHHCMSFAKFITSCIYIYANNMLLYIFICKQLQ